MGATQGADRQSPQVLLWEAVSWLWKYKCRSHRSCAADLDSDNQAVVAVWDYVPNAWQAAAYKTRAELQDTFIY